jgi:hypothetical protein
MWADGIVVLDRDTGQQMMSFKGRSTVLGIATDPTNPCRFVAFTRDGSVILYPSLHNSNGV